MSSAKTVSEVASIGRVTVRTLHHYDQIGLLRPSERSEAGYRLYSDDDLARLHDILFWRSLGFPLEEVRALLDDPEHDRIETLLLHREHLAKELSAVRERVEALDEVIRKAHAGESMTEPDLVALFDGFDPAEYEEEAKERWGHTDAWKESTRRTKRYGAAEWKAIRDEQDAINARFAELLAEGVPADHFDARMAAEAHRAHLCRWYYDCTPEIHLGLAETYQVDPRFAAHYEAQAPGLGPYITAAIQALHARGDRSL